MSVLTHLSHTYHYGPNVHAPHYVYRCYDKDGDLIYIGCTADVNKRIAAHRRGGKAASRWLKIFMARHEVSGPYPGRDAGREAEAQAIAQEQPVFNHNARQVSGTIARVQVARYLVERGHTSLACETACTCWGETLDDGKCDPWCVAHVAEGIRPVDQIDGGAA